MARKSKEDAAKTRKRILASALSLFARKGYERTTFTDIAARLKMTKGAVYWHFESKEKLLIELVELSQERFRRQIETMMPHGELTYPDVARMMVQNAEQVVEDPRATAYYRLMKCQIRWGDDSMDHVRENLLASGPFGPKQAFKAAILSDAAAGRVRPGVDAEEVATVSLALWDGLVQARIDHFISCDMAKTLTDAYAAIWQDIGAS